MDSEKTKLKYIEAKLPDGFTQRKYIIGNEIIYVEFNRLAIRVRKEPIEREKPKLFNRFGDEECQQ